MPHKNNKKKNKGNIKKQPDQMSGQQQQQPQEVKQQSQQLAPSAAPAPVPQPQSLALAAPPPPFVEASLVMALNQTQNILAQREITLKAASQELEQLKSENRALIETKNSLQHKIGILEATNEHLKATNDKVIAEMKLTHERDCSALKSEIIELRKENVALRAENEKLEAKVLSLSKDLTDTRRELGDTQVEVKRLTLRADQAEQDLNERRHYTLVTEGLTILEERARKAVGPPKNRNGIAELSRLHKSYPNQPCLTPQQKANWEGFLKANGLTDDMIDLIGEVKQQRVTFAHALKEKPTTTMAQLELMFVDILRDKADEPNARAILKILGSLVPDSTHPLK